MRQQITGERDSHCFFLAMDEDVIRFCPLLEKLYIKKQT
jgi:hypothetical protein